MAAGDLNPIVLDAKSAPKIFRPNEFVHLKAEMLGGDWQAIQNTLGKVKQGADGKNAEISLQLGDSMNALLQRMITNWNLERRIQGPDGSVRWIPLPYDAANVPMIRRKVYDYVYQTANKIYQEEEEEGDQTNFSSSAAEPTAEN